MKIIAVAILIAVMMAWEHNMTHRLWIATNIYLLLMNHGKNLTT